jgi:hypothetical protein
MSLVFRRSCVIFLVACFFAAQVHVCLEFDPCMWVLHGQGAGSHGACGHFCQAGSVNNWVPDAAPVLTWSPPVADHLEAEPCLLSADQHFFASHFGRSPPSA